jgi:hypothetical protein
MVRPRVFFAAILAALLLPSCGYDNSSHLCRENLEMLGRIITREYSAQELAVLFAAEDPWQAIVEDWTKHRGKPRSDLPADLCLCPAAKGVPCSMNRSLGNALKNGLSPSEVPIIWDRPGNHTVVPVYFLDGRCTTMPIEEFKRMLQRAQVAPQ